MILNQTPVRTSKNFKINNIEIQDLKLKNEIEEYEAITITGNMDNIQISDDVNKTPLVYGISKELEEQVYNKSNKNIKIEINNSKHEVLNLDFELNDENQNLVENIEIVANERSQATIIIKYISDKENKYYHNGILRITANEQSEINVVLVNMLNNKSNNFMSIENTIKNDAIVNYTIVDFGGEISISNYYSNLIGENSKSNLNTIYLGIEKQLFDINYIAELKGEKSDANIEVQGALNDNAKKNFKGTIDFKKGAKKAKGSENEFCILLSDKAKSRGLPMLLCTEEDVEGSHSSAAGKADKDMIFYIMSRGFSYKETMKLIVKAKFSEIIGTIQNEELREMILEEIDKRLD